jgi:CHU_C Type IX secretion signal domain
MKKSVPIILIAIISLFSCKKTTGNTGTVASCDGLITDTAGTNDSARIYMPTAFTPNGDGLNDYSQPYCRNIDSISFTIYNTNNDVVFTTTSLYTGWAPTTISSTPVKFYYRIQAVTTANRKIGICGELYELPCLPANMPIDSFKFEDQIAPTGFAVPTGEHLQTCH